MGGGSLDGYRFQSATWAAIAVTGTVFLTTFLYHFLSEAAFLTTVGKAAMGLHVGVEPGRSRVAGSAIRNILRVIDGIGIYLVGFLFATFTRRRQRVGDRAGHTFVVEWPIGRGGRAAVMFLMIVIAAAAIWISSALLPDMRQPDHPARQRPDPARPARLSCVMRRRIRHIAHPCQPSPASTTWISTRSSPKKS